MKLTVVDALHSTQAPVLLDIDERTTLAECRAMALSLPLASCERAVAGMALCLCHDGRLLEAADEEGVTLAELGVLDLPVVVLVARRAPAEGPTSHAARDRPTPPARERVQPSQPPEPRPPPLPLEPRPPPLPLEPPADAACRICFGAAFENGAGKLIAPCLCSGSSAYVHVSCLNEWRASSANPRSFYRCDQCQYEYNVTRTEWAAWLESERTARAATGLLLVLSTALLACILGPLHVEQRFYRIVSFDPQLASSSGEWLAALWGWPADFLVAGLLGVAAVGLSVSIRDAYVANRHMQQQSWLYAFASALLSNDERILRVFALLGLLHAGKVVLRNVEAVAKSILTKFGTRILEPQRS